MSSRWRIFYSLRLLSSVGDVFEVTATIGEGNGESLNHLPYSSRTRTRRRGLWH